MDLPHSDRFNNIMLYNYSYNFLNIEFDAQQHAFGCEFFSCANLHWTYSESTKLHKTNQTAAIYMFK